jgi:isocitrate dehydrogenase
MDYTVAATMTTPVVAVKPDTTVAAALTLMRRRAIHSVLVEPADEQAGYGIMTMTDVITKVVAQELDPRQVKVRELMTAPIVTASPEWTLKECANRMKALNVRRLPVVDREGQLVGIISDTDIFMAVEERGWESG